MLDFDDRFLSRAINSHDDIFAATYDYVFRSTDNGENWVHLTNGITNPYCWCLAINSLDYIFLGTEGGGGVFRSTDNGDTWTKVDNGLTTPNIVDALAINSDDDVFARTYGDGVFLSTNNV